MTVAEHISYYARIKGIQSHLIPDVSQEVFQELALLQFKNVESGRLSGGNKRKLCVAIAIIGSPPIVLLDEPSAGMDPEARRYMWSVVAKLQRRQ
jgi:ABC-type multidrug transport system ATPase subunit